MVVALLHLIARIFPGAVESFVRDYENEKVVKEYSHLITAEVM